MNICRQNKNTQESTHNTSFWQQYIQCIQKCCVVAFVQSSNTNTHALHQ